MTDESPAPLLEAPRDGVPNLVETREALEETLDALSRGTGPIAVDTERAQGFRYGAEAWLIQVRRAGSGTHLVDPSEFTWQLHELSEVIAPVEWVLHSASQDLPCLADAQCVPTTVFDTELAARLLGDEKVSLGALLENELHVRLAKEHSAADWSQRPLPEAMRSYAALDVELLVELRDRMEQRLVDADRLEWLHQECEHVVRAAAAPAVERVDPWRRTKGSASLRQPAQLALVRELWQARDTIALDLDKGPSRILPDAAIVAAAALVDARRKSFPDIKTVRRIEGFRRRQAARHADDWAKALERVAELSPAEYPPQRLPLDGPPRQPRNWERRHPERYARWSALRPVVTELAEATGVAVEVLLTPATLRELAWNPPSTSDPDTVSCRLREHDARPWQVDIVAAPLAAALAQLST